MPENLNAEAPKENNENALKKVVELAQRTLDQLYYPIDSERDRIEKAIESEFDAIRASGGWMLHESHSGGIVNDAAEVILKNSNRTPDVSENIQNINNLLEQHKNIKKQLQQYFSLNLHGLLMSAIQNPEANITVKDIEEALKEKGINI